MFFAILATALVGTVDVERELPRVHWEVAVSGTVPRGPGVHLELGAVLADRHVLSLRADVATIVVLGTYQLGASFAEWLTDWLTLGVGASFALHNDFGETPFSFGVQFPVRATFLLMPRDVEQRARRGLTIGLEVSPGYRRRAPSVEGPADQFSLLGVLSFGWASW